MCWFLLQSYTVTVSHLEIYNEELADLLEEEQIIMEVSVHVPVLSYALRPGLKHPFLQRARTSVRRAAACRIGCPLPVVRPRLLAHSGWLPRRGVYLWC